MRMSKIFPPIIKSLAVVERAPSISCVPVVHMQRSLNVVRVQPVNSDMSCEELPAPFQGQKSLPNLVEYKRISSDLTRGPDRVSSAHNGLGNFFVCGGSLNVCVSSRRKIIRPLRRVSRTVVISEAFLDNLSGGTPMSRLNLSDGALQILRTANAGGSSDKSEALSFEVLKCMMSGIKLIAPEMAIEYKNNYKTDYAISRANGECVGVSVTRAAFYKRWNTHVERLNAFSAKCAEELLVKKLEGVQKSTESVISPQWKWQILHILAINKGVARLLKREYRKLSSLLRENVTVVITVVGNRFPDIWGSPWPMFF